MSNQIGDSMESALVVHVPEAESAVARWRELYDPASAWGVPAHITILYPFVPPANMDDTVLARLTALLADIEPFDFVLDEVDQFDTEVLYLAPNPPERFVNLTTTLVEAWPEHQPYGGVYESIVPHLTIAHTNRGASFAAIRSRVLEELPIKSRAATVSLMTGTLEVASWQTKHQFSLG